jgi:SSS family solute:Na+ symporter
MPSPFSQHRGFPAGVRSLIAIAAAVASAPASFAAEAVAQPAAPTRGFSALDWMVVFIYGAVLVGIGFYYSRRQKTTEEYFLAGRNTKAFTAGISLFATLLSTITFVAMPGEMVQNGPVVAALYLAALPVCYLIIGWLVIPEIMRQHVSSAYELLEARLGRRIRIFGSLTFILTRLIWMALLLHTTSIVLVNIMGWDPRWVTLITITTAGVTIVYTLTGGFEAVMVTDVLQSFVLLLAAMLALFFIVLAMGSAGIMIPDRWMPHWAPQPFFSFDPHVRVTMVGSFISTIVFWICTAASDQLAIQRYLTTRDAATARRAFLLSNSADAVVTTILTLLGAALLAYYQRGPGVLPGTISITKNGDAVFAHFIGHYLPVGVAGLVVSGLLAAAMSSVSSGLNGIISSFSTDIIETQWPNPKRTEAAKVRTARLLAVGIGLITGVLSIGVAAVPGNLVEVTSKTNSLLLCPIFGLFFLALRVPFATPFGAVMGAIYSFAAAVVISYWDLLTGRAGLSFQWISPVAVVVTMIASTGFSLLPTRGKGGAIIAAYTAAALAPLAAFAIWILA